MVRRNAAASHWVPEDDNGNLEDLDYRNGGGTSVKRYQYGYDRNGIRTSMTDNDGVHGYAYDPLYQIIEATSPKIQRPLEQFAYDSVGNWVGGGRIHNELNQLTEDDCCIYSYDTDGNMTEKVNRATGDTAHFTWDIENKLTEVKKPGVVVRYVYDALGRRVSKEVNGVVTQFRYNGQDLILEMNAKDSITANYTFGPGIDNPLQMHRNGRNLYYVKDGLGSVTALTDSLGSVVHEYAYSVFGEIIDESGEAVENPFTFTAREWEPEVGLYYYRERFYDAALGRFISEDPIGLNAGDFNLYRYVENSPQNWVDPYGFNNRKPGKTPPKSWPTPPENVVGKKPKWNPEGYWEGKNGRKITWDDRSHGAGQRGNDGHWDNEGSNERWGRNGEPLGGNSSNSCMIDELGNRYDENGNRIPVIPVDFPFPATAPVPSRAPVPIRVGGPIFAW